ncbi:MAG: hypothetical protein A49_23940 [Methyloceanibacter sp.]|nr:MAG: hypothetical protein A49_23940 [Methyloceanibacter sp.]
MKWHVVCRIGEQDDFLPELETAADRRLILHFSGGPTDHRVREHVIADTEEAYDVTIGAPVHDLVYGAMTAYLADLCIPRESADDRWSRTFVLHLPVFEGRRWRRGGKTFASALSFLTGDNWEISTRERSGAAPEAAAVDDPEHPTRACLLSGGLDSLVGAIDLLGTGEGVAFVSHHGGGMTPKFQNDTYDALRRRFPDQCQKHQFFVVPPHLDDDGEDTMRSRSVLFLALGVAVASALGDDVPLIVPENGLISLNIPLTGTRVGSSSTRTTHPHFIAGMRDVLSMLGIPVVIELPYRHATKGEMLKHVADEDALQAMLPLTMSCSHPEASRWEGATPGTHCGYCFPCLIRRAAVTAADLEAHDAPYTHDARTDAPGGKKGRDLRALRMGLRRLQESNAPSILHALKAGPLPPNELPEFADVYARGMSELQAFLHRGE